MFKYITLAVVALLFTSIYIDLRVNSSKLNNSTHASISVDISGDSDAEFVVSSKGVKANTDGAVDGSIEFYTDALPDSCVTCDSPLPTFTPTPKLVLLQSAQERTGSPTATLTPQPLVQVVIYGTVPYNLRTCPSLDCTVVSELATGRVVTVVERTSDNQWVRSGSLWINSTGLTFFDDINTLPSRPPQTSATPIVSTMTPISTIEPLPTATELPVRPYSVEQVKRYTLDNHSRNDSFTRFWVYIHGANPTGGVSFTVIKDGSKITPWNNDEFVSSTTAGLTWPTATEGEQKQHVSNAKLEFRNLVNQAGTYVITPYLQGLADGVGVLLSESFSVTITDEDIEKELTEVYIEYVKEQ